MGHLWSCNLHTVLHCPSKTFFGADVKVAALLFTKDEATSLHEPKTIIEKFIALNKEREQILARIQELL